MRAHLQVAAVAVAILSTPVPAGGGRWPDPPGWWLHSSSMTCVRIRESGNGRASSNVYGMIEGWAAAGGSGRAGSASRAEQDYRAWRLWNLYGCHQPWGRYDGCC